MELLKTMKALPGSPEAKELGCTCYTDEEDENSLRVVPDCPIHWHLFLISKISDSHKHVENALSENKSLYHMLIVLALFMLGVLFFK